MNTQALQTVLQQWLADGNKIRDFVALTSLSDGYCSMLFSGKRSPNAETLSSILRSVSPAFADRLLEAWLMDNINDLPEEFRTRIQTFLLAREDKLQEEPTPTQRDIIRNWAIRSLDTNPEFFSFLTNLYNLLGKPN